MTLIPFHIYVSLMVVYQAVYNLQVGHIPLDVGSGFTGCYSSHIILEKGVAVIKLDDKVSDRVAAPINCALATVFSAVSVLPSDIKQTGKALVQVLTAFMFIKYTCVL